MKNVLMTSLGILCFVANNFAQNCSDGFYQMKEGVTMTYSDYNAKGKLQSTHEHTVKELKQNGKVYEATVSVTTKNEKGKVISEGKNQKVRCENGVIKMDVNNLSFGDSQAQMKDMEVQVSGDGVAYPSNLTVGQTLPDGATEVKMLMNGTPLMTMRFKISNQKVEAKESVTTPAGTFDCFKITYDMEINAIVKRTIKTTQWFSKGVGLIKTETYDAKKGELQSASVLSAMTK